MIKDIFTIKISTKGKWIIQKLNAKTSEKHLVFCNRCICLEFINGLVQIKSVEKHSSSFYQGHVEWMQLPKDMISIARLMEDGGFTDTIYRWISECSNSNYEKLSLQFESIEPSLGFALELIPMV